MNSKDLDSKFEQLLTKVRRYNGADTKLLKRAWKFTKLAHTGQKRLTGEPYISHPLAAASILAEWRLDETSIIAALLHDTVEDGGAKKEDLCSEFGEDVCRLVDGVTKVSDLKLRGERKEQQLENLRKLILVMAKDLRVVLVKLADRIHNMQTLSALPKSKQVRIARETVEVYAPLAERLGIGEVKGQLEDLAFPYLYKNEYKELVKVSKPYYKKAQEYINKMKRSILKDCAKQNIRPEVHAREKHLFSLWKKLQRPNIKGDIKKVNDIVAMRVVVESVEDAYKLLGIVHSLYKPIPHLGFSDFIAQPKPNGYRSIHTKVFGPGIRPVEVQITTIHFHEHNEFGFAAHWSYSEAKQTRATPEKLDKGVMIEKKKLDWVKQLVEWQKQLTDKEEFMKAVKFDALAHRNFIFSPKGDVYDLPSKATPVDFAFAVHTDMGRHVKAAKVNGRVVSLSRKLKSGDVVQIIKTKLPKKPTRDWLEFVATENAKRGIRKHMREWKK